MRTLTDLADESLVGPERLSEWHQQTKHCMALASPDLDPEELNYIISKEISELNKNSTAILRHLAALTVIIPFDSHHSPLYSNKTDAHQVQRSGYTAWIAAKPVWNSALSSPDPVEFAQLLGASVTQHTLSIPS